ncbi:enoyl-CoA hydratase/isomerase family protein [Flavobacterium jejuense]|uniref:Enoyl-CoA hydratase/isomerase family protein n=1 Tax=Flavobacterium jejuense TaxID=1544455 RepID=A0ABX0IWV8_9FLAO|nr:enoyl-CoA hydratase/isomerase family protein [Flavobacterium jejuense]NHN26546.1 enoyl-CoA hydratase/isomerase family protein [Flavobacterium jejuense]
MQATITTNIQDNIATISFFHPAGNSFPSSQLEQLTQELNSAGKSDVISVIILKSEGTGAFCAGASFDELLAVTNLEEGSKFFSGFANIINAMRKCPKLIIGRAHGKAVGGGVGLLAACDYVFAHNNAAVKLSELAIGIGPFVIEPAVSKKIGKTAMAEMTLEPTAWKNANWALEKGLFSKVFSSVEDLDGNLASFAEQLASYNPDALVAMKKVLWEGTENWDSLLFERAAISGRLVLSDFTKNALLQFKK